MIFFSHKEISENEIFLESHENDNKEGECILDLSGKDALLKSITFNADKPYIAEGLIKTAFNFAVSRNFYMGSCNAENAVPFLIKMGFQKTDDGYTLDIPSILMGSCCKK